MALGFNKSQMTALGFASIGGAMTGLAAGVAAKNCVPGATAGGRILAGIVIGALVGTVSALIPTMILYGNEGTPSDEALSGMGRRRVVHPQLTQFRYYK